uniref:Putative Lipases,hydrolases, acting on ester bonds isoform 1 n=1 Tax=Davidia involucrata TaxID=16924 RepID=A0A5B7AAW7_DAVIN
MNISALLTSAGINIAVCVVLFSLYSILRKQPSNVGVYFRQRLAQGRSKNHNFFCFNRLVPSPGWIIKAWQAPEEEVLAAGGLDAVVFLRIVVFSIRIFSIAAIVCFLLVLPVNYFGTEMQHKQIPSESLEVFTIGNVKEGSKWLWTHCLALYVISCSACVLLYFEYKSLTNMRMVHITESPLNPSHFTVLVRAIPWSSEESYSDSVRKFFTKYHASSYLSHQMVYRIGRVRKLMNDAMKMYKVLKSTSDNKPSGSSLIRCGLCGGTPHSFKNICSKSESVNERSHFDDLELREKECAAALVFFRTRYAAVVASQIPQSSNPMSWVTDLAPEPHDIYWKNLSIPYRQLWIRRIATLLAAIVFMFVFLLPVTFVQGLILLEELEKRFPFLRGILKKKFTIQLVTGYLPSVILLLFLYTVPPLMMLFSTLEGSISRSGRKKSACCKILVFIIWNVFFANVFSWTVLKNLVFNFRMREIPTLFARAVPTQGTFFMTYVMTSGWASLSVELMQPFYLLWNLFDRIILRKKDNPSYGTLSFPYHMEIPRVLLFGLLGFTCSILAPLILPFLLVYYFLAYLVYRNQFLNVYNVKYQSGGQFWPVVHNTTIFSLVLTQIIALGVFGLKESPVASGFTFPLIIGTLLFNEYCRQRFHPVFKNDAAEVLIEMDQQDEQCGRAEEIRQQLHSSYCQLASTSNVACKVVHQIDCEDGDGNSLHNSEGTRPGLIGECGTETPYLESGK